MFFFSVASSCHDLCRGNHCSWYSNRLPVLPNSKFRPELNTEQRILNPRWQRGQRVQSEPEPVFNYYSYGETVDSTVLRVPEDRLE